jgi:hypothetical protein
VLATVLWTSGVVQNLSEKAEAATGSSTPFTDAKTISFGVVNGYAHVQLAMVVLPC